MKKLRDLQIKKKSNDTLDTKIKNFELIGDTNSDNNNDDNDPKFRLKEKITEEQAKINEAIEKFEEIYKEKIKSKTKPKQGESEEEKISENTEKKNKKTKKKKIFKILLEKGKEIFLVKEKWQLIISALKKLFVTIDDKSVIMNQLQFKNMKIKSLISRIKSERLLRELVNSFAFKRLLEAGNVINNININRFVGIQNALIAEINRIIKSEKNILSSTSLKTAINMDKLHDPVLKSELQTLKSKDITNEVPSKVVLQKSFDETKLAIKYNATANFEQSIIRNQNTNNLNTTLYNLTSISIDFVASSIKNVIKGAISQIKDIFTINNPQPFKPKNFFQPSVKLQPNLINNDNSMNSGSKYYSSTTYTQRTTIEIEHSSIGYIQTITTEITSSKTSNTSLNGVSLSAAENSTNRSQR